MSPYRASTPCPTSARSALADTRVAKAGRPPLWAAGLSLFLVVALVIALSRDDRRDVAPAEVEAPRASPAEATAAMVSFVAGVVDRDRDALAALAPADSSDARDQLSGIAASAESLDLRDVTARYVDQVGVVADDGSWTGVVELTWRLHRFDDTAARSDVLVRFAPLGDELGIVGFGPSAGGAGRLPLWLRGELTVARADDVLVMVDGDRGEAEDVAARTVRGIEVVQRVLPGWSSSVVVEVPASGAHLDEALGSEPGTYAGIAAVTAPVGNPDDVDGPVHVFVNPDVTDRLRRAGAQVVMSHELVHIATDAVRRPVEPWLLEGFADYVALRDTKLPDRVTLARAIAAARRDGVPADLPSAADFDTRARDLQARYEEAWLACRIIARELGERGLVSVYRRAGQGAPPSRALRDAGLGVNRLIEHWRARLLIGRLQG